MVHYQKLSSTIILIMILLLSGGVGTLECKVSRVLFEGKVIASNGKNIYGSQIILTNNQNVIIARRHSDLTGQFNILIDPGVYYLIVSYGTQNITEKLVVQDNGKSMMKIIKFDEGFLDRNQNTVNIFLSIFTVILSILGSWIFWWFQNKRNKVKSLNIFKSYICNELSRMIENLQNAFNIIYKNVREAELDSDTVINEIKFQVSSIKEFILIWENLYGSIFTETVPGRVAALQEIKQALNNITLLLEGPIKNWLRLEKGSMDNARKMLIDGLQESCKD